MATHQKKHKKNIRITKELILCSKESNEVYGQIIATKGCDARFEVKIIQNNFNVIAKARGTLIKGPKKQRLDKDDYVLLQKDLSSDSEKYYIMHKYSKEDIKKLKKSGELATINDSDDEETSPKIFVEDDIIVDKIAEINIDDDFIANI